MKLHKNRHIYNIEVVKQKNCLNRILIKKIKRKLRKQHLEKIIKWK